MSGLLCAAGHIRSASLAASYPTALKALCHSIFCGRVESLKDTKKAVFSENKDLLTAWEVRKFSWPLCFGGPLL